MLAYIAIIARIEFHDRSLSRAFHVHQSSFVVYNPFTLLYMIGAVHRVYLIL